MTNPLKSLLNQPHKDTTKTGIQVLKDIYLNASRIKYPTIPDYARAVPAYSDKTANGLTKCVIDFINLIGNQAERISNTGRQLDNRKAVTDVIGRTKMIGSIEWIPGTGTNGTADISATIQGRSVKIEIKAGKDRQSQAQKSYQEQVERAGGIYLLIGDFQSFYRWYLDNIIKR